MRTNTMKSIVNAAVRVACLLLFGAAAASGQVQLTAGPSTAVLPDGTSVPMWGYTCGTGTTGPATCVPLNMPAVTAGHWSPVLITVPAGQDLNISLTNSLNFTGGSIPTSLVIVGQVGGGLGTVGTGCTGGTTCTKSPDHSNAQSNVTWPIAGPAGSPGTPPAQGNRIQSFSTEVTVAGGATTLTWSKPRPGTYLLESGTHPSIQVPMGLYGIVVVTQAPSGGTAGAAYPGDTYSAYSADVALLMSEIDPVQNNAVQTAVNTSGFSEVATIPVNTTTPNNKAQCVDPVSGPVAACYPPAVNYTPLYYLINGQAFDKTNIGSSNFPTNPATGVTGNVLVRFVNAGLRMHIPSIVGSQTGSASGFSLIAEDGNPLPGIPRVQSEVFMAAGKTYDVMINAPACATTSVCTALPVFDRQLSLSGNATSRDAGMLAYISANGASATPLAAALTVVANADSYSLVPGNTLTISDPSKGVIANDVNVYGVHVLAGPTAGTLVLNTDGTFMYTPNSGTTSDSFTYCANGSVNTAVTPATCSSGAVATVALNQCTVASGCLETQGGITVNPITYTAKTATYISIKTPGILSVDSDKAGYPLTVAVNTVAGMPSCATNSHTAPCVLVDQFGGFTAYVPSAGTYNFTYQAMNSQGTLSAPAQVTLVFPAGSGLQVKVLDGYDKSSPVSDYRWIIEEDRTFYVNPANTTNTCPQGQSCPIVPTFGTNFHTSYMPVIATGCVGVQACEAGQTVLDMGVPCTSPGVPAGCSTTAGQHVNAVCDIGNGTCEPGAQQLPLDPGSVALDPTKRYYISILPGDAGNDFSAGNLTAICAQGASSSTWDPNACGHGMGGAPILFPGAGGTTPTVTVYVQPAPFPTAKLSVFVFEDDFPLNGEQDGGGGIDVLSPNEPGLGGFQITLFDDAGGTGDATGQPTYDMFNQPLSNSLAGTPDPANGNVDACPISSISRIGTVPDPNNPNGPQIYDVTQTGITGMIVTCPKYEADGKTLSPLAGQAVVANLYPGRYGVVATPAADRIARGEEWLQTNTLDGQKAHDSFLRIGEPSFFQEYGPAGYHVSIGFANPQIINARLKGVCNGSDPFITGSNCTNTISGTITTERMSRPSDERLYSSGSNASFAFTQCYVSFGDPDGEDFAFTKCDSNGHFVMSGLPDGDWRVTVFDQWNDMLVDGLSTPVRLDHTNAATGQLGEIAMNQWQANIYTTTFFDANGNGVRDSNEAGLTLVATNIRFRDGSFSNFNNTDLSGNAGFNEVFPLFSWYVLETDSTRYKNTGTHVVYDAGGPADGTCTSSTANCGSSVIADHMANTYEATPVPGLLHVPGAVYCNNADCTGQSITDGPNSTSAPNSTGRIDPPWVQSEAWQGFSGQNSYVEFGKTPYAAGENGGIRGHVVYASTRPFDDPQLLLQLSWEPLVPGVTINLYKEGTAPDGTTSLTLVDTTKTTSWDDWAQGFRADGNPNMNCPGQSSSDLFYFTLYNQPMWLDLYNNGGTAQHTIPANSQFKCFDGMHNWNQLQPAPYDGMYQFPSIVSRNAVTGAPANPNPVTQPNIPYDPATGRPNATGTPGSMAGTNCTICVANPTDSTPMLPSGKYVVEVVVPAGYELVKEEDKNILIGDNYIAPVTVQFPGLASAVYILPDQAQVGAAYNPNNSQNPTVSLGRISTLPSHEGDTGEVESYWPCVGELRVVPDYISLFPQSAEVSPFAGAVRPLCDRKEVHLDDQTSALAKFYIFTSTHVAAHFTGVITDDFTSEFDPYSPQFGEKFSPPNMPIAIKDWSGTEISRVYSDWWGTYNGLTYSTWEVNPPNPTGYAPQMMVTCMNDPGTGPTPDPLYNPQYSNFCYEIPFMPGQTQYMDTPVVPTSAFAGAGYNNPDCAYPALTPAIKSVTSSDIAGPWVDVHAGGIDSLVLTTSGSGYTNTPSFTITQGADATATGQVTDLKLVSITTVACSTVAGDPNRCSNYASNPPVTITGGGPGSGATATASVSTSAHTITFTVTNAGSGYTSRPTVRVQRLTGNFFNRFLTVGSSSVIMGVDGVVVTNIGTGYTGTFAINLPGGGIAATAQATASTSTQQLTITALGDVTVPNNAYAGPSATTAPYNQKTVPRHYGFGGTAGTVTIGGVVVPSANITGWNDTTITLTVPNGVPVCPIQQQAIYGGTDVPALCGELVIKAANGKSSVDAVTITIGGKKPTVMAPNTTIQSAIDAASPGDMIIVPAGVYQELLLMWKPVRLQGVGAASSIINANTHPAGKVQDWRTRVNCLFGLALNGTPVNNNIDPKTGRPINPFDPTGAASCGGWAYFQPTPINPQVDRLPLEATVGWDASLNGNLAELLQEPSLMGALEGAAITVLSKGVNFPSNPFDPGLAAGFPVGTPLLTSADCLSGGTNPFPSSFICNPSSIDGLGITNSSQGGGGVFVHGWGHYLQIANNRIYNNAGTLSGGINLGQGEHPGVYTVGGTNADPGSCQSQGGLPAGAALPYCFDIHVNIHNNYITQNSSTGDELFSATPAGAGGVSICTGADYYQFNYNWVCGNLSTGDGGGFGQLGLSFNGDIEHNSVLFNQATNPTIPTNGGGILIMGAPDVDPTCGVTTDADCAAPGTSDGVGNVTINANLIMGNGAESGSGGGIRIQGANGTEVVAFPNTPSQWYKVTITNNIIANNVAGWDGAGISLLDALNTNLINNTIMSNDTTASSGVLFNTLGAPVASSTGPTCTANCGSTSNPQPAGLVAIQNSAALQTSINSIPANIGVTCPTNHYQTVAKNGSCRTVSYPEMYNNVFWQNRAFYIGVTPPTTSNTPTNQQATVALFEAFTSTVAPSQPQADATSGNGGGIIITGGTGACTPASGAPNYWDIGVRGDTGPGNHGSGVQLAPIYSVLTNPSENALGSNNRLGVNPTVLSQYCNGSRVPPELGTMGYQVPPGISDATVPNPVFNLTPAATVDEGNNWINISWGPLSETHPLTGALLGNYALAAGSPAIDQIPVLSPQGIAAPNSDFFGNPRKTLGNPVDIGAVEFVPPPVQISPSPLSFGNVATGTVSNLTLTLSNTSGGSLTGITVGAFPSGFSRNGGTCTGTLTNNNSCTIIVQFAPTAAQAYGGQVSVTASLSVAGSPVTLSGTGVAPPAVPTLTVLDNFNRANANTLGANWTQFVLLGSAAIRVNTNQASDVLATGNAFWSPTSFGTKEAAAFTIVNTTITGDALVLGASGTPALSTYPNFVRVVITNGTTVTVATTTNGGLSFTTAGTLNAAFVNGDTITAQLDGTAAAPTVNVWRNGTFLGSVALPVNALWQGGGRIGVQLPAGARVDNFAGGTTP